MQPPTVHGATHLLRRVRADGRKEAVERAPVRSPGCALPERVPQVREGRVPEGAVSAVLGAAHDPRLLRMEPETDVAQPSGDPLTHISGLLLAETVNHDVVAIPLEQDGRERPGDPLIERVTQEEI